MIEDCRLVSFLVRVSGEESWQPWVALRFVPRCGCGGDLSAADLGRGGGTVYLSRCHRGLV